MNKTGILLIHGFAGDVGEIKLLQDYLVQRGYEVACPLLPGHGMTKAELAKSTYCEWIDSVEQTYLDLSRKCSRIIVIGFSMGGLLAVNLWNYGFTGLVTINTPVYYWNPKMIARNLLTDFRMAGRKYLKASTDKSFSSMLEFQKLLTKTKPMFQNVSCRTLVVQALDDDTVKSKSAYYIMKKVRADIELCKIPQGGHNLLQSKSGNEVCRVVGDFIQGIQ